MPSIRVLILILLAGCAAPQVDEAGQTSGRSREDAVASTGVTAGLGVSVAMLNVGQGDCGVVRLPNGGSMVIDCGSTGGLKWPRHQAVQAIRTKIQKVTGNANGVDALVLTHPDRDHYNLVADVFSAASGFSPGTVYIVGQIGDYSENNTAAWLATQTVYTLQVNQGQPNAFLLMQGGGASVTVVAAGVGTSPNDQSAVLAVQHGGFEALMTADATGATNTFIQSSPPPVLAHGVNFYKIEHHGADTHNSNSAGFVGWLSPPVSAASCAQHMGFGHPRLSVVQTCLAYAQAAPAHPLMTYDPRAGWQQFNIEQAVYSTFSTDDFLVWTDATGSYYWWNPGPI